MPADRDSRGAYADVLASARQCWLHAAAWFWAGPWTGCPVRPKACSSMLWAQFKYPEGSVYLPGDYGRADKPGKYLFLLLVLYIARLLRCLSQGGIQPCLQGSCRAHPRMWVDFTHVTPSSCFTKRDQLPVANLIPGLRAACGCSSDKDGGFI